MDSGILLIDKPEGPSSAQVVQKVKGILGAKKVGHLGTPIPLPPVFSLWGSMTGQKSPISF